jgi:L-ornithine N5-monooxygenase
MTAPPDVLDLVGVGFGPSNLALAIAFEENPHPVRAAFLERQHRFGWHRGMLIDGATMQVSFLKDLVTMRDPTSDYSFVAYLHAKGRLPTFINRNDMIPTRAEFHDYLGWAAGRLRHRVSYDHEVTGVRPVVVDGDVRFLDVSARRGLDGTETTVRARNIVVATGLAPNLPADAPVSPRVWHSDEFLRRLADVPADQPQEFVVVGAGQSAAEVVDHLHRRHSTAKVHSVFTRYGYSPADDSPFVNAIFDPAAVDLFHQASQEVKEMVLAYHSNTNYSVVDRNLIVELHRRAYNEDVTGERKLVIRNMSRVIGVRAGDAGVDLDILYLPDRTVSRVHADWLVYATGYRPRNPFDVLGELSDYCKTDPDQALLLERGHRVATSGRVRCGIYVQGVAEASHGLAATLLSTTAVRAGEIADAIVADLDGLTD